MSPKTADQWFRSVVVFIMLICFGGMLYGYIIRPPLLPANPPEILLPAKTGPVLLMHASHCSDDAAAMECVDCHHSATGAEDDTSEMRCRTCHYDNPDVVETVCADDEMHPRCIGKHCMTCHDGEECVFCHRKPAK